MARHRHRCRRCPMDAVAAHPCSFVRATSLRSCDRLGAAAECVSLTVVWLGASDPSARRHLRNSSRPHTRRGGRCYGPPRRVEGSCNLRLNTPFSCPKLFREPLLRSRFSTTTQTSYTHLTLPT